ncbi:sugar ABC transporter permease [Spirochaetia bacterium]|nr:sugar ABC transporter permease [Spirochaetia bacterium]
MKKSSKKCALISALIVLALLVSCGGKSGGSGSGGSAALMDPKTPVTITYWYPLNAGSNTEADLHGPGMDKLFEATGVTIQWQAIPAAGTAEQYNLLMASGDLPDVVAYNVRGLKDYYQAFLTVDNLIKENPARYPNLNKYLFNDEYLDAYLTNSDGRLRIVPMLATRRIGDVLMLRQDLLQKYNGGQPPVTADDWYKLLTAAKADGKIGFASRQQRSGILYRLLGGYMDCVIEDYFVEDGVVKYGVLDPRLKDGVELARKWYAEGLIDKEYPTTDSTRWWEAVLRGDVFATHDNIQRIASANNDYINNQNNAPYRIMGVGPLQSPRTGKRNTVIHYPRVRDKSAAISINAKNPERILDFFEYCFTDEGFILMNFGIEGQSFSYVNGVPFPDPTYSPRVTRGEVPPMGSVMDMVKNQRDELFFDYNDPAREDHQLTREARDLYMNNDFIRDNWIPSLSFTDEERTALAPINAELNTYRGEMLDKFIMGVEPMSSWDNFVAQIQKMNLDTAIKIHQTALDRMLKK